MQPNIHNEPKSRDKTAAGRGGGNKSIAEIGFYQSVRNSSKSAAGKQLNL